MEITKETREQIVQEVRDKAGTRRQYEKPTITVATRQEIADKYGVSVSFINSIVKSEGLTWQRQWTEKERRDIWCNYERLGMKILADKYHVTPYAIRQQIQLMRHAEQKRPNPWQKG